MKKILLVVFLAAICGFSWFSVLNTYKNGSEEFEKSLALADSNYEKKVYDTAEEQYKSALKLRPKDEKALLGLAKTYFAEERYDDCADVCEQIREINDKNEDALYLEANSLISGGKYSKALEILSEVEQSEKVKELIIEAKSKYSLKYLNIKEPKNWLVNSPLDLYLSIVKENNSPRAYNSLGKSVAKGDFSTLGPISEDKELYPAINDGKWCFVDKEGKRRLVPDVSYDFLGPFNNGFAVAKKDKTYGFIDKEFNEYSFEFEKAYNFFDGKAVVCKDGVIEIIDTNFKVINKTKFSDVKADEYGYTDHFGVFIFMDSSKYYLCNSNGEKISEISAEYIGLPMEKDGLVEFKQNDMYGFISSKTGEIVINAAYDGAKAFASGLAPIMLDEKWGYIDEDGQIIVEPIFKDAGSLSDSGTAWVSNEAGYALISFYHLSD